MASNPYAKSLGRGAGGGKRRGGDDEELYEFNSNTHAATLIQATIGNPNLTGQQDAYGSSIRPPTGSSMNPLSSLSPPVPGGVGDGGVGPRPMTSVRGAGYRTSAGDRPKGGMADSSVFDPLAMSTASYVSAGPPVPLVPAANNSTVEGQQKLLEKQVHQLLEDSAKANKTKDFKLALDLAKDAGRTERRLFRLREQQRLDQNIELMFGTVINLANQYTALSLYSEALSSYTALLKHVDLSPAHKLRVRIQLGYLYFSQKKYPAAIKMYRMALDQLGSAENREMKKRMLSNIGICFLKLGSYVDAISSFEAIFELSPAALYNDMGEPQATQDVIPLQVYLNMILCYFALGEIEKMKRKYIELLNSAALRDLRNSEAEDDEDGDDDLLKSDEEEPGADPALDATKTRHPLLDELRLSTRTQHKAQTRILSTITRLIAPQIDSDLARGFDWCSAQLRNAGTSSGAAGMAVGIDDNRTSGSLNYVSTGFPWLSLLVELWKGISYLQNRQFDAAIEVFKSFEKINSVSNTSNSRKAGGGGGGSVTSLTLLDSAATNLSFLYFLEGDIKNSEKYAELAVRTDRYNARALVNRANILYKKAEMVEKGIPFNNEKNPSGRPPSSSPSLSPLQYLESAKELYLEAIGVEADCSEAIYNLGLTNKKLGQYRDAIQAFKKLHRLFPRDCAVLYQLGDLCDKVGDAQEAILHFLQLHSYLPTDASVLNRLGTLYSKSEEERLAFSNFSEAHSYWPVSMETVSWLGVYYVKQGLYEDAIQYFTLAAELEFWEVKWQLMVASCYRRMEEYSRAESIYKRVHRQDPDNIECLTYLCSITKQLGKDLEYEEYARALERAQSRKQERVQQQSVNVSVQEVRRSDGPTVSPEESPRHGQQHAGKQYHPSLADRFSVPAGIGDTEERPTFQEGRRMEDEWGDGELGDELLP